MDTRIRNLSAALAVAGLLTLTAVFAGEAPAPAAPPVPYVMPAGTPDYVRKAVEAPGRPGAADDFNRKPAELLTLAGVKPGDRVVEFGTFGQYFTTMLSSIVGEKGLVYMYDLPYTEARSGAASKAFAAAHPNSRFEIVDYNKVELPQNIDGVYIVLYYHDLYVNKIDTAAFNAKVFKALKPGGVYFIVDHNAEAGSGLRDVSTQHRIDPAAIKQDMKAAGFELVEDSKLLSSSKDEHKQMVFAKEVRRTTDQSVLKFRKPLK